MSQPATDLSKVSNLKEVLRPDFYFGYATAATQVEGAALTHGKGPSIWDKFASTPGKVLDDSTPTDSIKSYYNTALDVALLKSYGVTGYRFSLAWTRIIPLGGKDDPINEEGISYYNGLIDELLKHGITPFVTLFHWDVPQALEDRYRGMLNQERYTPDFVRYADVCFAQFGDRVKHWITYNEPGVFTLAGYAAGVHAPARSSNRERNEAGDSSTETFVVGHTELVSHGHAVKLYREKYQLFQNGEIGITLHGNYSVPWDEHEPKDVEAAQRAIEFEIAWFADPIYGTGDYPASMREQLGDRLPKFTPEERALVMGSSDFYGMNSYTTFFVRHLDTPADINDHSGNIEKLDTNKYGKRRGPMSDTYWLRSTPWGFRPLLNWVWKRYKVPIYITENGTTAKGEHEWVPTPGSEFQIGKQGEVWGIDDTHRCEFFEGYITAIGEAVKEDGVDVRSYFAWTFTDNWGKLPFLSFKT